MLEAFQLSELDRRLEANAYHSLQYCSISGMAGVMSSQDR